MTVEPDCLMRGQGCPQGSLLPSPSPGLGCHAQGPPRAQPCRGEESVWLGWCGEAVLLRPAGFVMGCVLLGLAGQHMMGQQEELQIIYEGE